MDIDLGRNVLRAAFRSASELQSVLPVLKDRCSPEEYQSYAHGIAAAVDAIGVSLINKVLAAHPVLNAEIEASVAKHGRYI